MYGNPMQPNYMNDFSQRMSQMMNGQAPGSVPSGQGGQLNRVNGIGGAQAFPVAPGETVPLFDLNQDVFYIKTADSGGFPSLRTFSFQEIFPHQQNTGDYVSRKEFEELKGMIADVQQSLRKSEAAPVHAPESDEC